MSTVQVRADIFEVIKNGGDCEFVLKNASRGTPGWVLTNVGDGVTEFAAPTGGASRFGVSGEDDVDLSGGRIFSANGNNFTIQSAVDLNLGTFSPGTNVSTALQMLSSAGYVGTVVGDGVDNTYQYIAPAYIQQISNQMNWTIPAWQMSGWGVGTHLITPAYLLGMDASGNVGEVDPAGTVAQRFAFATEDDTAAENRAFDATGFDFEITQANLLSLKFINGLRRTEWLLEDGDLTMNFVTTTDKFAYVIYDSFGPTISQAARDQTTANIKHGSIVMDIDRITIEVEESSPFISNQLIFEKDHFQWTTLQATSLIQGDLILGGYNGTNDCGVLIENASASIADVRDASAIFEVKTPGTPLGVLLSRMSTGNRTGIASPAEGLLVYDITLHNLYHYNGTVWVAFGSGGGGSTKFGFATEDDAAGEDRFFHTVSAGTDYRFQVGDLNITVEYGLDIDHSSGNAYSRFTEVLADDHVIYVGANLGGVHTGDAEISWYDFGATSIGDAQIRVGEGKIKLSGFNGIVVYDEFSANTFPTPDASAILDIQSLFHKGFLEPRMTTTQKNAIASPAEGLQVFDTTLHLPYYYNGSAWVAFATSSAIRFGVSGEDDTAGEDRNFDLGTHEFKISNTASGGVINFDIAAAGGSDNIQFKMVAAGNVGFWKAKNNAGSQFAAIAIDKTEVAFGQTEGIYSFTNVAVYANNAAAITGGLTAGKIYRTNGDPDLLAIVH